MIQNEDLAAQVAARSVMVMRDPLPTWCNPKSNEKSVFCSMVLRLMDSNIKMFSENYYNSLQLVCDLFPEVDIKKLNKELDRYV